MIKYTLLLLLFSLSAISQTYEFDYVLEYNTVGKDKNQKAYKISDYIFINTESNSNMLVVNVNPDKVIMRLFTDANKYYMGTIANQDFFVEAISIKCPFTGDTHKYMQSRENNDYYPVAKKDTVINTQPYAQFSLKADNKKKGKDNELYTQHYIMDNSLKLPAPALQPGGLGYKFWRKGQEIPNGIIKEHYSKDALGNVINHTSLIQAIPVKKIIIIDKNCK